MSYGDARIKRGRETAVNNYTPLMGELVYDMDGHSVYIGDGSTAKGWPSVNVYRVISTIPPTTTGLRTGDIYFDKSTDSLSGMKWKYWNGTSWVPVSLSTNVSDVPANTIEGQVYYSIPKQCWQIFSGGAWTDLKFPAATTARNSPVNGDVIFDLNDQCWKYFNGTNWIISNLSSNITTQPADVVEGDIYFDTATDSWRSYFNGTWRPVNIQVPKYNPDLAADSINIQNIEGFIYIHDTDKQVYMRESNDWHMIGPANNVIYADFAPIVTSDRRVYNGCIWINTNNGRSYIWHTTTNTARENTGAWIEM